MIQEKLLLNLVSVGIKFARTLIQVFNILLNTKKTKMSRMT